METWSRILHYKFLHYIFLSYSDIHFQTFNMLLNSILGVNIPMPFPALHTSVHLDLSSTKGSHPPPRTSPHPSPCEWISEHCDKLVIHICPLHHASFLLRCQGDLLSIPKQPLKTSPSHPQAQKWHGWPWCQPPAPHPATFLPKPWGWGPIFL